MIRAKAKNTRYQWHKYMPNRTDYVEPKSWKRQFRLEEKSRREEVMQKRKSKRKGEGGGNRKFRDNTLGYLKLAIQVVIVCCCLLLLQLPKMFVIFAVRRTKFSFDINSALHLLTTHSNERLKNAATINKIYSVSYIHVQYDNVRWIITSNKIPFKKVHDEEIMKEYRRTHTLTHSQEEGERKKRYDISIMVVAIKINRRERASKVEKNCALTSHQCDVEVAAMCFQFTVSYTPHPPSSSSSTFSVVIRRVSSLSLWIYSHFRLMLPLLYSFTHSLPVAVYLQYENEYE